MQTTIEGMPIWLRRIGEHPAGLERLEPLPMALLERHEARAIRNHGQSLKQLRDRGGLSVSEAVAIMEDRPMTLLPIALAVHRLADLVEQERSR